MAPRCRWQQRVSAEIDIRDLCVSVGAGTARERRVLDRLALTVRPSSICAVVGRSGCGKTTFLKSVAGVLDDQAASATGKVQFRSCDGSELSAPSVGMVFQRSFLLPWRTALQNVALNQRIQARSTDTASHAQALLERVGLAEHGWKYPHELSGGMQQRVALAREFARPLDVLLMDEPFRMLDCVTHEQLIDCLLMFWREQQTTIVMVTHDPMEAVLLADVVFVLDRGRVAATLEVSERLSGLRGREARTSPHFQELVECVHTLIRDCA